MRNDENRHEWQIPALSAIKCGIMYFNSRNDADLADFLHFAAETLESVSQLTRPG